MQIAQITDLHLLPEKGAELYGVDTGAALEKVIEVIINLEVKPDLIVATGDLAEDASAQTYQRLQGIISTVDTPVYVLPGNHDDVNEMQKYLVNEQIKFESQLEFGDWLFAFVNTKVVGESHGFISQTEMSVLEGNITKANGQPMLIALHHTPTDVCPSKGCQLHNAQALKAIIERHPNVKAVLAGHTHTPEEEVLGECTIYTTPSTFAMATHAQLGASVDHNDFWDSHQLNGDHQGFRVLELKSNGGIQSEVVWV
jgi:3',5'-cyclic-AMP phosphodiesterase